MREARERTGKADPGHAGIGNGAGGDVGASRVDDDAHWPRDGRADRADGVEIGQSGREQHVGPHGFEGFQAGDRVFEVEPPVKEVLRTRGHDEPARRPCCRDGLANPLDRMVKRVTLQI